jgi:quinol-cytochrome oxidoreductase complex cytochrome b subunit
MLGQVPGIGAALQQAVIGGSEIGTATIINFYALHVAVTPLALLFLMNWHFWRIRMAGGVVLPSVAIDNPRVAFRTVPLMPDLLLREATVALVLIAFVIATAVFFAVPLGDAANPGVSPNPAKAPWYFLGFQELLIHFNAMFAVLVIPLLVVAALAAIPFLPYDADLSGDWFLTSKGRRMATISAVTALVFVPLWVLFDERVIGPDGWLPDASAVISNGLIPFLILLAAAAGFYKLIRR